MKWKIVPSKHFKVGSTLLLGWYDVWHRDVAQRQINVETTLCTSTLKFTTLNNVDLNNVRQCWNNVVIFNVDFHNVGQRRNNVGNMTISKKIKPWLKSKIIFLSFKEYAGLKISFSPFQEEFVKEYLQSLKNS